MCRFETVLAALVLASAVSIACSSSGTTLAPTPVDSGPATQQPGATNPRPPSSPTPPTTELRTPEHPDRCDHRQAQAAVGHSATSQLLEQARVAAGAETARFLRLGEPTTLEYRIGRLNLSVDAQDVVRRVECW